jgi:DNA-binding winged helix-turn-helix (wHTH) protein/Tol biopolymer transport system component
MSHTTPGPARDGIGPSPSESTVEYQFGPFRMDAGLMQLWNGSDPVPLTPKAFDTLLFLIQHRHRLVRKDELISAVWANSFVSEDSLTQNITALRRALGDDHHQPEYIGTVPRRGYRFIAPVTETAHPGSGRASEAPPTAEPSALPPAATRVPSRRGLWNAAAVAAVAAAVGALAIVATRARQSEAEGVTTLHFTVHAPTGTRLASGGELSPDGQRLAFIAQDTSGTTRLWVHSLRDGSSRVLEGTEGAGKPFWSPDGESIGFFAGSRVKRVGAAGGPVRTLASTVGLTVSGGTWGRDDQIVFASFRTGLTAVPASGGDPSPVTELDGSAKESAHRWPQFLPDGRLLFSVYAEDPERAGTYVSPVGSASRARVLAEPGAVFAPPGHLLWVQDRVLMAQRFDLQNTRVEGPITSIAGNVFPHATNTGARISASAGDLLSFGGREPDTKLQWFDRSGKGLGVVRAPTSLYNPSLSADQRQLLAGSGTDVWLIELERDAATRIVAGNTPLLSPDGSRIAFTSGRLDGVSDVYLRPTTGPGEDRLFLRTRENKIINDWSRDGRYLVFASTNHVTKMDLWVASLTGDQTPRPLLTGPANEFQGQISPDGRWLAYASDESGTWEVYLQAFPSLGAKRAVSAGGGSEPQWRSDGRELFYVAPDGKLMAVAITPGEALQVSRPTALFQTPIPLSPEINTRRNHYVASSDGQRFLINAVADIQESMTVLVNWSRLLPE